MTKQNNIAIKVENVSKVYQKKTSNGKLENFYALQNINFEIKKGEIVGIIGKNGSGKSTLLKILSGVTKPSKGDVEINGVVASILDVGTGFHPDLSGRENIYLRGELLGMAKKEIDLAFDEIVGFSEIGEFIETPVKNYSSGMFLRLAFSVMIFLKCDILLLDEVLSVGDAGFREKSNKKLLELIHKNVTIIVVSHDFNQILPLVNKCILIDLGKLHFYKSAQEAILFFNENKIKQKYSETIYTLNSLNEQTNLFGINNDIHFVATNIEIKNEATFFSIRIRDMLNNNILIASPFLNIENFSAIKKDTVYSFVLEKNILNQGTYYIDLIYSNSDKIIKVLKDINKFTIKNQLKKHIKHYGADSLLRLNIKWNISTKDALPKLNIDK